MKKNRKKWLALLTAGAMLLTSVNMPFAKTESKAAAKADMTAQESMSSYGLSNPAMSDGVTTWDCIYFGNYWQEDTNGDGTADQNDKKQPIKWRVLSVDGDDAFVVADEALDCQRYNEIDTDVTWETCTLRTWLNSTFMNNAFSAEERSAIKTTTVVNEDNIDYGTAGGNTTMDRIFLLSQNEVKNPKYGFNSHYYTESETRQCKTSVYAVENGCHKNDTGNCWWWLRSPGDYGRGAAGIFADGGGLSGDDVFERDGGLRPVLNMDLSSSSWMYAGMVSAIVGGENEEQPTSTPNITPATPTLTPAPTAKPNVTPTAKPDSTLQQTPNRNVQPSQMPAATLKPTADSTKTALKKVTAFKAKALKKALKLTWKKAAGASGYEIQYSLNKNFKKAKKIIIKKASVKTRTIKGLKKNKKYYIRIRATMKKGKRKINGPWVKTVKKTKA